MHCQSASNFLSQLDILPGSGGACRTESDIRNAVRSTVASASCSVDAALLTLHLCLFFSVLASSAGLACSTAAEYLDAKFGR